MRKNQRARAEHAKGTNTSNVVGFGMLLLQLHTLTCLQSLPCQVDGKQWLSILGDLHETVSDCLQLGPLLIIINVIVH